MKKRIVLALLLCSAITLGTAGCGKGADEPADGAGSEIETEMDEEGAGTEESKPEAPDGFVDNSEGLDEMADEEKYDLDETAGLVLGVRDEKVFFEGNGFATRFATNLLSGDPESDGSKGLPLAWIWDRVDYIKFGDKEYTLSDLVRPCDEGFQVLEQLSKDFGVTVYESDAETGALTGAEHKGSITGDELREAYSEREDLEDYTICVYYLDAQMGGMETSEYEKARGILSEKHGTDSDQVLDGTLAVMLYYDTEGYDMYYNIAAIAPGYFQDAEDFKANMDAGAGHDITNCHMLVDGETRIGFVNQVFIRCDSDTVPDHTIEPGSDNNNNARIEEGAPEGAEISPTGSVDADSAADDADAESGESDAASDAEEEGSDTESGTDAWEDAPDEN